MCLLEYTITCSTTCNCFVLRQTCEVLTAQTLSLQQQSLMKHVRSYQNREGVPAVCVFVCAYTSASACLCMCGSSLLGDCHPGVEPPHYWQQKRSLWNFSMYYHCIDWEELWILKQKCET